MPISRSFLQTLDKRSAQYVYCHAAWRRSRGKKEATEPYGGILNPELALDLAMTVMVKLSRVEDMNEQGLALLESGKNYSSASEEELCLMVHYLVEEADDPLAAKKLLCGMLEVPTDAILEVVSSTADEYLVEFRESLVIPRETDKALERKIVSAMSNGVTATTLREIFRSRGGLCTKDGAFISVLIGKKGGAIYNF